MAARHVVRAAVLAVLATGCGGRVQTTGQSKPQLERIGDAPGMFAGLSQDADRVWWSWSNESGPTVGIAYFTKRSGSTSVRSEAFGGFEIAVIGSEVWSADVAATQGRLYATSIETGVGRLVRSGLTSSLAVDARSVFFTASSASGFGRLTRVPREGGEEQTLASGWNLGGTVVDDTYLYFLEDCNSDESCGHRVRRCRKDLSTFDPAATTTLEEVAAGTALTGLVDSGSELLWGEGGTIVGYDKTNGTRRVISSGPDEILWGLAVDAINVYFLAGRKEPTVAGNTLYRVPRTGGAVEALMTDLGGARELIADDTSLYFLVTQPYPKSPLGAGVYRVRKPKDTGG